MSKKGSKFHIEALQKFHTTITPPTSSHSDYVQNLNIERIPNCIPNGILIYAGSRVYYEPITIVLRARETARV